MESKRVQEVETRLVYVCSGEAGDSVVDRDCGVCACCGRDGWGRGGVWGLR